AVGEHQGPSVASARQPLRFCVPLVHRQGPLAPRGPPGAPRRPREGPDGAPRRPREGPDGAPRQARADPPRALRHARGAAPCPEHAPSGASPSALRPATLSATRWVFSGTRAGVRPLYGGHEQALSGNVRDACICRARDIHASRTFPILTANRLTFPFLRG